MSAASDSPAASAPGAGTAPGADAGAASLEELRALEQDHQVPAYARLPAAFVRGEPAAP